MMEQVKKIMRENTSNVPRNNEESIELYIIVPYSWDWTSQPEFIEFWRNFVFSLDCYLGFFLKIFIFIKSFLSSFI